MIFWLEPVLQWFGITDQFDPVLALRYIMFFGFVISVILFIKLLKD